MCRYAMSGPYKQHWACFGCRKMFRQNRGQVRLDELKCPNCKSPMRAMGLDFKAPPTRDAQAWKSVEMLFRAGNKYSSCGCDGPGERPRRLREVESFLQHRREVDARYEEQKVNARLTESGRKAKRVRRAEDKIRRAKAAAERAFKAERAARLRAQVLEEVANGQ